MYTNFIQTNFNKDVKMASPQKVSANKSIAQTSSYMQTPINTKNSLSFTATNNSISVRTQLTNTDETQKYSYLVKNLDKSSRKQLDFMLKTGSLLNNESNDKSTTLDNLYKIATTPRAQGLDNKVLLKETVNTLANPFVITQQFGDIPDYFKEKAINANTNNSSNLTTRAQSENDINVLNSGTCVSASIEFNLANKKPAEFARMLEGLSSPKIAVDKEIELKNLTDNTLDSVWLLNAFEIPYKMDNFDKATLTLAPDKNAIIRAQIQNSYKDPLERSVVDVLMQSTFMNIGSQQSYNTLTDTRAGKFNSNDRGLIEFEKTFTESIVENKNKTSVTYQIIDDNERLTGYETDLAVIKKHITETLATGENVIIGYTQTDENNKIINGHEITIIGTRTGNDGKTIFICNDTDDDNPNPIEYHEDYLIPKIHHAGLPQSILNNDVQYVENWKEGLNSYRELKNQSK